MAAVPRLSRFKSTNRTELGSENGWNTRCRQQEVTDGGKIFLNYESEQSCSPRLGALTSSAMNEWMHQLWRRRQSLYPHKPAAAYCACAFPVHRNPLNVQMWTEIWRNGRRGRFNRRLSLFSRTREVVGEAGSSTDPVIYRVYRSPHSFLTNDEPREGFLT